MKIGKFQLQYVGEKETAGWLMMESKISARIQSISL